MEGMGILVKPDDLSSFGSGILIVELLLWRAFGGCIFIIIVEHTVRAEDSIWLRVSLVLNCHEQLMK